MTRSEDKTLRSELTEARFAIQRQLELLRYPNAAGVRGPPGNGEIMTTLEGQLKEIEEALANLEG